MFGDLPLDERQRVLAKLAKLKALAECPTGNVNETATAAAAMTRLMQEYRIEVAELQTAPAPSSSVVEEDATGEVRGKAFPGWQLHLLTELAEAHDCCAFETRQTYVYAWGEKRHEVRLALLGAKEDIEQTRFVYGYCVDAIERLCASWGRRQGVALRNDFKRGAAVAVGRRAREEREAVRAEALAQGQTRALVWLDQQLAQVQEAAVQRGVHTVTRTTRRPWADAFDAGFEAGSRVALPGRGLEGGAPGLFDALGEAGRC